MLPESCTVDFSDYCIHAFKDGDYISQKLLAGVDWAEGICRIAKLFLAGEENPIILDVGANLGSFALKIGSQLRGAAEVVAFEPQPMIFYHLCSGIVMNKLSNVRAHNIALGDYDGMIEVPTSVSGTSCNYGAVSLNPEINAKRGWSVAPAAPLHGTVPIHKLDSMNIPGKIGFMKLDVEGFESAVLRGAEGTLEHSNFPPMLVEVWQDSKFSDVRLELLSVFQRLGYSALHLPNGEWILQHPKNHSEVAVVSDEKSVLTLRRIR
ncbi:FkbM family methyltransferase [Pseudorhodobacter sp. E13]|uniref:FkbM family methyltransferase n=1 Tax=Pseudorhodobacter sp. E13 TaxID=2487931 RepID=UPI000F8C58B8|nr:FkbM family methyltransferase [Pseudorhodobacter sp. E13]RUS65191.1 FkbM family methyltransferase [Pseudorhodobacter sp. E13]